MTQSVVAPSKPRSRPTTMRAAVLAAPRRVELTTVEIPTPLREQVLVRLEGCGVCASNLPPYEGREWFTYPMSPGQLGHEGWGMIEAVGDDVHELSAGQRVAFLSNHAYAEYDVTDAGSVVTLPATLDEQPFPAEPLGCAINILNRSHIEQGQTIAIVGVGFLGALLVRLASRRGARVVAIARRPMAQRMAQRMGASHVLAMDDHYRVIEAVKSLTQGTFCDVVIEAVGKQWPLDLSAELTREGGRLVVAGYHQDGPRSVNMQLWNWRGLDVINAHERDPRVQLRGMRDAVTAVASGVLDPTPLYTHQFPLEQLGEALEMTGARPDGFFKALIRF